MNEARTKTGPGKSDAISSRIFLFRTFSTESGGFQTARALTTRTPSFVGRASPQELIS
jgi:hypothetical protein